MKTPATRLENLLLFALSAAFLLPFGLSSWSCTMSPKARKSS